HDRPATTLTTPQSSANSHAHNVEHPRTTLHQHRPRPPGQPTPRPATTPTTSNTRMTYDIDNNHDHTQATHQPPNNQPQYSGERHPGEAGRVTPGKGREQDTRQPNPRPAGTPTASNINEAHAIDNDDGQHDDLDLGQQPRPPNRTLLWNTPSTTT